MRKSALDETRADIYGYKCSNHTQPDPTTLRLGPGSGRRFSPSQQKDGVHTFAAMWQAAWPVVERRHADTRPKVLFQWLVAGLAVGGWCDACYRQAPPSWVLGANR